MRQDNWDLISKLVMRSVSAKKEVARHLTGWQGVYYVGKKDNGKLLFKLNGNRRYRGRGFLISLPCTITFTGKYGIVMTDDSLPVQAGSVGCH